VEPARQAADLVVQAPTLRLCPAEVGTEPALLLLEPGVIGAQADVLGLQGEESATTRHIR